MTLKTIFARDYGILPNTCVDYTKHFQQMFYENPSHTTFILESGTYTFSSENALQKPYFISNTDVIPTRFISLYLKDMEHIILEGNGSQFVYQGQVIPLTLDHCEDITIQGISIDWCIPLSSEGRIMNACDQWVDIQIDPTLFPHYIKDQQLWFKGENWEAPYRNFCEFDQITKKVAYRTGDAFHSTSQEQLQENLVRFHGNFDSIPTVGNYGVIRHNARIHPGIFIHNSKNITLLNLPIHNTGGLGVLAQFSEHLTFKGVRFESSKVYNRQFVSGHDDGLHLSNNKGLIHIENCWFHGLMDDPINVHGTTVKVIDQPDDYTLKGTFVEKQSVGFDLWAQANDQISFIDHITMASRGLGTVQSYHLLSPNEFTLTFTTPIPSDLQIGDSLENITRSPSLICRNNYFGSCRARGLLVSTPQPILIENNVFESAGAAILIAGDANYWYESGACTDVIIRGNHFSDCCMTSLYQFCNGIISIYPEIPAPDQTKPFHRNISITNNTFMAFDYSVLYALSTCNLEFSHNKIIRSYTYLPFYHRQHMINLEYCTQVKIHDNQLIGDVLGQDISIGGMAESDLILSPNNTLSIVHEIPQIHLL